MGAVLEGRRKRLITDMLLIEACGEAGVSCRGWSIGKGVGLSGRGWGIRKGVGQNS